MANKASTKDVTKRMDDSFLMGYREGKFKVLSAEVAVVVSTIYGMHEVLFIDCLYVALQLGIEADYYLL